MTSSQIDAAVCAYYQLFTHKPNRALRFERNICFFVEYLWTAASGDTLPGRRGPLLSPLIQDRGPVSAA